MKAMIPTLFYTIASALRERCYLSLEMLALRHQLAVLERSVNRPQFSPLDRCLWIVLSTLWSRWPHALAIMQADTVRRWRRQGFRHHLRWPCGRKRPGRPAIPSETRALIGHLSRDNVLWGAPRIHGELAMLGIKVSRTTVAKYMSRCPYPPSPTWRTCIRNHAYELMGREAYAELLPRVRALSARLLMALRCWLDRGGRGWEGEGLLGWPVWRRDPLHTTERYGVYARAVDSGHEGSRGDVRTQSTDVRVVIPW
jgi:hypothetical protein